MSVSIGSAYTEAKRLGIKPQATLQPQPAIFIYPPESRFYKVKTFLRKLYGISFNDTKSRCSGTH